MATISTKSQEHSYHLLRNIRTIRPYLNQETTKTIIHALVMSRLDYCNLLLDGTADYQLNKLQTIQNMACRIVYNLQKYDHLSEYLQDLHWLRIKERITFKIAMLMYKIYKGIAPGYLTEVIKRKSHTRNLRSRAAYETRTWNQLFVRQH